MKTTIVSILTLALAGGVLTHSNEARAQTHRIVGDFAEYWALTTVNKQARLSYTEWTTWGSGPGGVGSCPNPGDWVNCWVYWQAEPAGGSVYAALRVEPLFNSLYLLAFEDPSLTCFVDPGDGGGWGFGRPSGSSCIAPNYAAEPRTALAHGIGEWYSIWVEAWDGPANASAGDRFFDLESFRNTGDDPLDLWVLWHDNNWYVLEDLGPGTHDVSWWAYQIRWAQLGTDTGYSNIDDVIVNNVLL